MTRDTNKVEFFFNDPVDKIIDTGTFTIANDGNTTAATGSATGPQSAKIVQQAVAHSHGKSSFIRYKWSIDGTNYNAPNAHLLYAFTITYTDIPVTSDPLQGLKAAVSVGCDATNIYFRTANGMHGDVSTTLADPDNGYTPTSLTFTIQWAMYEREL